MSIWESIGIAWVILNTLAGTATFFFFAVKAAQQAKRQMTRGQVEEARDVYRQNLKMFEKAQ